MEYKIVAIDKDKPNSKNSKITYEIESFYQDPDNKLSIPFTIETMSTENQQITEYYGMYVITSLRK